MQFESKKEKNLFTFFMVAMPLILFAMLVFLILYLSSNKAPSSLDISHQSPQQTNHSQTTDKANSLTAKENKEKAKQLAFVKKEVNEVFDKVKDKYPEIASYVVKINRVDLNVSPESKQFTTYKNNSKVLYEIITPQSILYTNKEVSYLLVGNLFLGNKHKMVDFTKRPAAQKVLKQAKSDYDKYKKDHPDLIKASPLGPVSSTSSPSISETDTSPSSLQKTVSGSDVFNSLPFHYALNYTYGNGDHHIAVFEDPDCPFCEHFHQELKKYGKQLNVNVSVFPFVLTKAHPHGMEHAKALMCMADPQKAWNEWMLYAYQERSSGSDDIEKIWNKWLKKGNREIDKGCPREQLVDGWEVAAKQLGFSATPSIMFKDGTVVEGFVNHEQLSDLLDKVKDKMKAKKSLKIESSK